MVLNLQVRIGDFGLACKDILVNDHDPLPSTANDSGKYYLFSILFFFVC